VAAAYRAGNAGLGLFLPIALPVASSAPPPERHRLASVGLLRELAKRLNAAPALSISSPPEGLGLCLPACPLPVGIPPAADVAPRPRLKRPVSFAAKALKRR
jgi:hypothetical protein